MKVNNLWNYIWKEKHEYVAAMPIEEFRIELRKILRKASAWQKSVNMTGDLNEKDEFEITPKWQLIVIKNGGDVAYLQGKILSSSDRTKVIFTVRPNSAFLIVALMVPVFGVMALATDVEEMKKASELLGWYFITIAPLISIGIGYFSKMNLRNRFINTFKLRK